MGQEIVKVVEVMATLRGLDDSDGEVKAAISTTNAASSDTPVSTGELWYRHQFAEKFETGGLEDYATAFVHAHDYDNRWRVGDEAFRLRDLEVATIQPRVVIRGDSGADQVAALSRVSPLPAPISTSRPSNPSRARGANAAERFDR